MVGAYNLECVEAITNGGRFKLVDPNGAVLTDQLLMTAGAGAATIFTVAGMQFTVTDGATDFVVGDKFSLTVAADGKIVVFATDGVGGAQNPKGVLSYDVTATEAGNEAIRMLVTGKVRKERLVIDGSAANVGLTAAILDALRDMSIVPIDVNELNILDNQ